MIILDIHGGKIESPDLDRGHVVESQMDVWHTFVIDTEEEYHWEPQEDGTVDYVVDVPYTGHVETVDDDGTPVEHYDGDVPNDLVRYQSVRGTWRYGMYVEYTGEELERHLTQRQAQSAAALMFRAQAASLTDEEALSHNTLFSEWGAGGSYKTGEVVRYGGDLYRLLQDVTGAQAEHTPDVATSLYKRVGEPDPSGVWPWVQPLGATDAYKAGDKVSHNGKVWVSTVDNNVWEPGVYGWDESK